MHLKLEFSGGMELLFGNQKAIDADIPEQQGLTVGKLLVWVRDNLLTERPELFMKDDTVSAPRLPFVPLLRTSLPAPAVAPPRANARTAPPHKPGDGAGRPGTS